MMRSIEIKRGGSLSLAVRCKLVVNGVEVQSLDGWTITSQVRRKDRTLVADLTVVMIDAARRIVRLVGQTNDWPLVRLQCDVLAVGPGGTPVVPSTTFELDVVVGVTERPVP